MRIVKAIRMAYLLLSAAMLILMVVLPATQVGLRNVFSYPLIGAESFTKYFLICFTFFAAAVAVSGAGMIEMTELRRALPARLRNLLNYAILSISGLVFLAIAVSAVTTSVKNSHVGTALGIPFWLFMLPGTIGLALLAIEYFVKLVLYAQHGEAVLVADLISEDHGARPSVDEPQSKGGF